MQDYSLIWNKIIFIIYFIAHVLCIPTLYTIYLNKLDHLFLVGGTCLTSLLRWGFPANIIFQNIDHSFVKLVFFTNFFTYINQLINIIKIIFISYVGVYLIFCFFIVWVHYRFTIIMI